MEENNNQVESNVQTQGENEQTNNQGAVSTESNNQTMNQQYNGQQNNQAQNQNYQQYNMQPQNQNYQGYNGQQQPMYGPQQQGYNGQPQMYAQAQTYGQQPQINQFYIPQQNNSIPSNYKPISAWGYVGWDILFSIPLVGLILLIVFACGGADNENLKKYARSKFCALLLVIIILAVLYALVGFSISMFIESFI